MKRIKIEDRTGRRYIAFSAMLDGGWIETSWSSRDSIDDRKERIICDEEKEDFINRCVAQQLNSDEDLFKFYFDEKEVVPTRAGGWKEAEEGS